MIQIEGFSIVRLINPSRSGGMAEYTNNVTGESFIGRCRVYSGGVENPLEVQDFHQALIEISCLDKVRGLAGTPTLHKYGIREGEKDTSVYWLTSKFDHIGGRFCEDRDLLEHMTGIVNDISLAGIRHNDITPWNTMRDGDLPAIIDFGNAVPAISADASSHKIINSFEQRMVTPSYLNDMSMAIKTCISISRRWEGFPVNYRVQQNLWDDYLLRMDINRPLSIFCLSILSNSKLRQ